MEVCFTVFLYPSPFSFNSAKLHTVESLYNKPRYNELPGITNYTILQKKGCAGAGCPSPPIISIKLPQQIIYRRKGTLSESPNHFKSRKNILISRFYEQFSRSGRILGHFWKFENISNSWNTNISYIIVKRVIWRFHIYNLFREKFKFRGLTKAFKNFAKYIIALSSRNLNISRNKLYIWNLQITRFKMIYDPFVFQEFEIFSNFQKWPRQLRENCS